MKKTEYINKGTEVLCVAVGTLVVFLLLSVLMSIGLVLTNFNLLGNVSENIAIVTGYLIFLIPTIRAIQVIIEAIRDKHNTHKEHKN